jgi:hypothetical protein
VHKAVGEGREMTQEKGQGRKAQANKATTAASLGGSMVNQRQTRRGVVAVTVIPLFAAGLIGYVIMSKDVESSAGAAQSAVTGPPKAISPASASRDQITKDLPGITVRTITDRDHVEGVVVYGVDSPPFGGKHNQNWAVCTGVVYTRQLANENVVHSLEHGGIWLAYDPALDSKSVATLKSKVLGYNFMLMTPYAGLKKPVALQAWGYQMFFDSVNDPKIDTFIRDLRLNPNTTPEYGAPCDNPRFVASDSYPGHPASLAPLNPATGGLR